MGRATAVPALCGLVGLCGLAGARNGLLASHTAATVAAAREAACTANNLGVALMEQFRPAEAAQAFSRASAADARLSLARVNLALALQNAAAPEAAAAAQAALEAAPESPQAHYVAGLVARAEGRAAAARAAFERVLAADPADTGALVNRGQLELQERRYAAARTAFEAALAQEPYHATALYNLGQALARLGLTQEAAQTLERFRALRESGHGVQLGQAYPDQGRYAEVQLCSAEDTLPAEPFELRFEAGVALAPATAAGPTGDGGGVTLVDVDGDGRFELFGVGPEGQRLWRQEQGRWSDATRAWGLDPATAGQGALAGDLDNDGDADLLVLRPAGPALLRHEGRGYAAPAEGLGAGPAAARSAALWDADHDGDLDVFVSGAAAGTGRLLRNRGMASFEERTPASGLAAARTAQALLPVDFDSRRDVDLLLAPRDGGQVQLWRNLRDGSFREVAAEVGLGSTRAQALASADLDRDGRPDFLLCGVDGVVLAYGDGRGRLRLAPGPGAARGARQALFFDADNDARLDLLLLAPTGLRLLRGVPGGFEDVSASLPVVSGPAIEALAVADLDGDGDSDVVLRQAGGALRVLDNRGSAGAASLSVHLAARVSNRSAVGVKVELLAGSLRQRIETSTAVPAVAPADVLFGLGRRRQVDALRLLWPAGIVQTEVGGLTLSPGKSSLTVRLEELDRKPSSCPYLFAWDGRGFEFVSDFLGGGELGYFHAPGRWSQPVPEEWVRLEERQLALRHGRYELRVTHELEEVLYLDRLALHVLDHDLDSEVFPNEGLAGAPRRPFEIYAVRGLRPVARATDDLGRDVSAALAVQDRRFADGFALERVRGYARPHTLTLELGELPSRPVLLLTGFTEYAFSSDNVAAGQAGLTLQPPVLQVPDGAGGWRDALTDVGFPVGRPQTLVVDLQRLPPEQRQRVRLTTNLRIYWDRVALGERVESPRLSPAASARVAVLRERGFSAGVSPDGRAPFGYAYERVGWASPWKTFVGRYTRLGDVRELLRRRDDRFVRAKPGDELTLSFAAADLPPRPPGARRTFLFYAHGYSKEMDINSASPHEVEPLPFHGMAGYPYDPRTRPHPSAAQVQDERRWHTRVVHRARPSLELDARVQAVGRP